VPQETVLAAITIAGPRIKPAGEMENKNAAGSLLRARRWFIYREPGQFLRVSGGLMDRRRFRLFAVIWLAVLVGFIALFPYLLYGIVKASSCERVGGACGAVAVVVGTTIKPLVIGIAGIVLLRATWRRMRRLEMSRLWIGALVMWYLGSVGFLIGIGNFWGANFSMGMIGPMRPPVSLLFLLAFMGFLAAHADDATPSSTGGGRAAWLIAAVAAMHAIVLSLFPMAVFVSAMTGAAQIIPAVVTIMRLASFGIPWTMAALIVLANFAIFIAALAYILIGQRRSGEPVPA
jgi:hypothetical protein